MTEKVAEITFPPEWLVGRRWLRDEVVTTVKYGGRIMVIAGGVLDDGMSLIGLGCLEGCHCARYLLPLWAIEERVDPTLPDITRTIWRHVIESMISGRKAAP